MRLKNSVITTTVMLLTLTNCNLDEPQAFQPGQITFSFKKRNGDGSVGGRTKVEAIPAFASYTLKKADGSTVSSKVELLEFKGNFVTNRLQLQAGPYTVEQFLILDAGNQTIYATPKQGSDLADLVEHPLPLPFDVVTNEITDVMPEVLSLEDTASPTCIKLDYYTESFSVAGQDFQSRSRVNYEYDNDGNLQRSRIYSYNPVSKVVEEQATHSYYYLEGKLKMIEGFLTGTSAPNLRYTYQYLEDARVAKITEVNLSAGVNSVANFEYTTDSIKIAYAYSNGGSFGYSFKFDNKNIVSDKTTRGAELCSNGYYTYDQSPNPFKLLGYVDYTLLNLSTNNKLTQNVNYIKCSFPNLIPVSHAYEYDINGYPQKVTTSYMGSNLIKSQKIFFYKMI